MRLTHITEVTLLDWIKPVRPNPEKYARLGLRVTAATARRNLLPVRRWMASLMTTIP